jgi:protein-S-isoprenylcysteine O-methyltransferase Ste14
VNGRRLPSLGPRGEGWFAVQLALLGAIGLAGGLGPAWHGGSRTLGLEVGTAAVVAGGLLALWGLVDLGRYLSPFPKPLTGARLVDCGAYALVRHPIYGGLIVAAAGWGLVTASPPALLGAAVLAVFFDLKSRREEVWLAQQFDAYEAYRARTRRLLPWLY